MWGICKDKSISQVENPKYIVPDMEPVNTPIGLNIALSAFETSRTMYTSTPWDFAPLESKARALRSLIKLGEDVLLLDPANTFVQVELKRFREQLHYEVHTPDVIKFEKKLGTLNWGPEIEQQKETFADDYRKFEEGRMDYATMRSMYG